FGKGVTRDPFARAIERSEMAVERERVDDVVGTLNQRAVALLAAAQVCFDAFAAGDVARDAAHAEGCARAVADERLIELKPTLSAARVRHRQLLLLRAFAAQPPDGALDLRLRVAQPKHDADVLPDQLFLFVPCKDDAGRIDAGQTAFKIVCVNDVTRLLDEVAV